MMRIKPAAITLSLPLLASTAAAQWNPLNPVKSDEKQTGGMLYRMQTGLLDGEGALQHWRRMATVCHSSTIDSRLLDLSLNEETGNVYEKRSRGVEKSRS